jgi:hypothetical protein
MSPQSRLVAGIVLIIVPTVAIGGASILSLLIADPAYAQNDLRQDLWRAGHAHAGVWLVLSLIALRCVDEATLSEGMRWVVRVAFPIAAVLMALGFFMSVLFPDATEPNAMIYLTYVAGLLLAVGLLVLGIGLIRGRRDRKGASSRMQYLVTEELIIPGRYFPPDQLVGIMRRWVFPSMDALINVNQRAR